jgi:ubiquinone/menaquinone biosynthesis C-methylase UbiE
MTPSGRANVHVHYSAALYDKYSERFLEPYDDVFVRRLVAIYARRPGCQIIVDVGTGTARLLLRLMGLEMFREATCIAVDLFPDMVEVALRNVRDAGCQEQVAVVQGDAHALPLKDGLASHVISRSTLHHWADPALALREMHRILEPGGSALIHEVRRDPPPGVLEEFNHWRARAGVEPSRVDEKYTLAQMRQFVIDAGLSKNAHVFAPETGMASLGVEILLTSGRDVAVGLRPSGGEDSSQQA